MAIFGLIGYPLEHSFSPSYMNRFFYKERLSHYYEAFPLRREELEPFMKNLRLFKVRGINITIPYKVDVLLYIDEMSEEVEMMNACNVINVKDDKIVAYNTDWYGFTRSLETEGIEIKGKKAFVYGSGGAAKSVVYALARSEVGLITVLARTPEKAMSIIDTIEERYPVRSKIIQWTKDIDDILRDEVKNAHIIVNTTPLGMYPHTNDMPPVPDINLEGKVFFDLVYNPLQTKFLEFARERGAYTISGIYMLMYQGAKALSIWLSDDYEDKIREVFRELNYID